MSMSPEELAVHRDLQYLRAAGIAGANRRGRRRNRKPVNKSQSQLRDWVHTRGRKLDEMREAT